MSHKSNWKVVGKAMQFPVRVNAHQLISKNVKNLRSKHADHWLPTRYHYKSVSPWPQHACLLPRDKWTTRRHGTRDYEQRHPAMLSNPSIAMSYGQIPLDAGSSVKVFTRYLASAGWLVSTNNHSVISNLRSSMQSSLHFIILCKMLSRFHFSFLHEETFFCNIC